ncbi:MAG TPA: hypothetical protein VEB21_08970, partial [Terriglobales bacterium]|nr:hypothetical protein [Terriglobales bacterium]
LTDKSKIVRLVDSATRTRGRHIYQYKRDGLDLVFQPWWLEPMTEERLQHRAHGWELMRKALLDMRATAQQFQGKLVVVLIPTKEEVYFDTVRTALPNHEKLSVDRPYTVVEEFCRQEGILCCSTTAALQDAARRGEQVYLRVSGHWNQRGNEIGAAAVRQCLQDNAVIGATTTLNASAGVTAPAAGDGPAATDK